MSRWDKIWLIFVLLTLMLLIKLWAQNVQALLAVAQTWTAVQTFDSNISAPNIVYKPV